MKTVVAAALGECVHVAGVVNFLRMAENAGWRTVFLGPAVSIEGAAPGSRQRKCLLSRASLTGSHQRLVNAFWVCPG
jgi:hypothetical protein